MGKVDCLDDLVTVGLKGKSVVEGGTDISEFGDFEKGEGVRDGREVPWEIHDCVTRARRWVGVSWKTMILDLHVFSLALVLPVVHNK